MVAAAWPAMTTAAATFAENLSTSATASAIDVDQKVHMSEPRYRRWSTTLLKLLKLLECSCGNWSSPTLCCPYSFWTHPWGRRCGTPVATCCRSRFSRFLPSSSQWQGSRRAFKWTTRRDDVDAWALIVPLAAWPVCDERCGLAAPQVKQHSVWIALEQLTTMWWTWTGRCSTRPRKGPLSRKVGEAQWRLPLPGH